MHVGAVGWVLRNLVRVGSTRSLVRVGTLAHTRTRSHTHSPTEIAQVGEPIDEHRDAASLEREGVGVSGRVDMGGWVLGGCACGSAHACTCLPRGAARACGGHPCVRQPFRGRHSRTFETRSTRGPNGIPQNFFQSPPRRESGTISPTRTRDTIPVRPLTLSNFRHRCERNFRTFELQEKVNNRVVTDAADATTGTASVYRHPAASHCLHLELRQSHRPPGASLRALSSPLRASTLGGR